MPKRASSLLFPFNRQRAKGRLPTSMIVDDWTALALEATFTEPAYEDVQSWAARLRATQPALGVEWLVSLWMSAFERVTVTRRKVAGIDVAPSDLAFVLFLSRRSWTSSFRILGDERWIRWVNRSSPSRPGHRARVNAPPSPSATSNGLGANMAPKMLTTRSKRSDRRVHSDWPHRLPGTGSSSSPLPARVCSPLRQDCSRYRRPGRRRPAWPPAGPSSRRRIPGPAPSIPG